MVTKRWPKQKRSDLSPSASPYCGTLQSSAKVPQKKKVSCVTFPQKSYFRGYFWATFPESPEPAFGASFRIVIPAAPWQGGTGLDTYQICIQARFDTFSIKKMQRKTLERKTLKTCTAHRAALDARARTSNARAMPEQESNNMLVAIGITIGRSNRFAPSQPWAMIWGGGCKTYGGRKTYQTTRPPDNFSGPPKELLVCWVLDFCTGKQSNDIWGGRKSTRQRGVQNWLISFLSSSRRLVQRHLMPWERLSLGCLCGLHATSSARAKGPFAYQVPSLPIKLLDIGLRNGLHEPPGLQTKPTRLCGASQVTEQIPNSKYFPWDLV